MYACMAWEREEIINTVCWRSNLNWADICWSRVEEAVLDISGSGCAVDWASVMISVVPLVGGVA